MTTKERIYREIEQLDDKYLDEVYTIIRQFTQKKLHQKQPGLMSKLRQIQIDGPGDFVANLELYVSGEKHA